MTAKDSKAQFQNCESTLSPRLLLSPLLLTPPRVKFFSLADRRADSITTIRWCKKKKKEDTNEKNQFRPVCCSASSLFWSSTAKSIFLKIILIHKVIQFNHHCTYAVFYLYFRCKRLPSSGKLKHKTVELSPYHGKPGNAKLLTQMKTLLRTCLRIPIEKKVENLQIISPTARFAQWRFSTALQLCSVNNFHHEILTTIKSDHRILFKIKQKTSTVSRKQSRPKPSPSALNNE